MILVISIHQTFGIQTGGSAPAPLPNCRLSTNVLISPFSVGPFNCVGKAFAMMEAKVFLSKLVAAFELQFAPGEDGSTLLQDVRDYLTWYLPDLRLCLVPIRQK